MKILEVMTEHTGPFKTLIEVLKDMLQEVNMEFRCENPKKSYNKNKNDDEEEQDSQNEEADENNEGEDEKDEKAEDAEDDDEEGAEKTEDDDDEDEEKDTTKSEKGGKNSSADADKNGLRIMAVDTTKTVLINLKLDAKNFTTYKCAKKKITLGVNLIYFHKLIKSMDKEDNLTLFVEHDDKNYLRIRIDNPEVKKDSTFKLKLLDLGNESIKIPVISFDAVITMNSSEFHKICREMNQIADYVEIRCLSDKIIFTCKGDYAERTTTYRNNDEDGVSDGVNIKHVNSTTNAPIIVQGIYELRNLVLFSKCASLCNDIEIYMKNNFPLVIKYTVATLGRILLCLTPINEETANYSEEDEFYSDDDVKLLSNL